jgi:hypothetical protein
VVIIIGLISLWIKEMKLNQLMLKTDLLGKLIQDVKLSQSKDIAHMFKWILDKCQANTV